MGKLGFDNHQYLSLQTQKILERVELFGGKLYLEFGGKLFDDFHASRVLPGFLPDSKLKMLLELKDQAEIVMTINAGDIASGKCRADLGISYDQDVLRLLDVFRDVGLLATTVVLTQYHHQQSADQFAAKLKSLGIGVYYHYSIPDYPANIPLIVSDQGFGKNDYVETTRPIVVVTAPGPGSGKMATCLSQLYHEHKRGIQAGYAKYETFPIWNLPLKHPVNLAYEAATADLSDVNMIDPFHLEAYGETTVNYNRDVEIYPVVEAMFQKIYGKCPYKSPTDMGVNMAGLAIFDDEACREASRQEILRRYFAAACDKIRGNSSGHDLQKIELLMNALSITPESRPTVSPALDLSTATDNPAVAIQLAGGTIITGKTTALLGATSAALLNALKFLGNIPDHVHLIDPAVIAPIQHLKTEHLGNQNPRLHTDELLIALSISAVTDPNAEIAMEQLVKLESCQVHASVILSSVDETVLKKLGANVTCQPVYEIQRLYRK